MSTVALATCSALPAGSPDDRLLAAALRARGAEAVFAVWDDADTDWARFEEVVIRSTWDYTDRHDDFLRWARSLGAKLRNPVAVVEWNSDKRYLADLEGSGVPTVPTLFVGPGDPEPRLEGEVVIKPTVSAGARDTGRFSSATHDRARQLLARMRAAGRTSMVQPYLEAVEQGETAIVLFAGHESHVLRKRPVLGPDEEAPLADNEIGAAKAMFDEELVVAGSAGAGEGGVTEAVLEYLQRRFGAAPTYARVDLIADSRGRTALLELELVEPSLYLARAPGSAERFAEAVLAKADQ